MRLRIITFVLIVGLGVATGCAQAPINHAGSAKPAALDRIVGNGKLVMGTSGDMPPMSMTTKDKKVIGYDIDLGKLIADAMGVTLEVKRMSFAELLPALKSGEIDIIISGMTITPRRNLDVAFAGP